MVSLRFDRIALEIPTEISVHEITISPLRQELATKATKVLGYGLLQEHIQGIAAVAKRCDQAFTLSKAFAELGIQPLHGKQVTRYKKKRQGSSNLRSFFSLPHYAQLWVLCNLWNKLAEDAIGKFPTQLKEFLSGVVTIACAIGVFFEFGALIDHKWLLAVLSAPLVFTFLSITCEITLEKQVNKLVLRKWAWKRLNFVECYREKIQVPEFALDTAVRVKERLPEADLFVEVLVSNDRTLGDPFLCLQYAGEKYHLEVWDESRFEECPTVQEQ